MTTITSLFGRGVGSVKLYLLSQARLLDQILGIANGDYDKMSLVAKSFEYRSNLVTRLTEGL